MKQPYDNPDCKEHRCPYCWTGKKWECMDYHHDRSKEYCLVRIEESVYDWIEFYYDWVEIDYLYGRTFILKVNQNILDQIKKYENKNCSKQKYIFNEKKY